jgi:hypothetical protein
MEDKELKDENPEHWDWIRTSLLMPDGSWATEDKTRKVDTIEIRRLDQHWHEKHHYLYINCYGENQSCMAEIRVEEREWLHKPTGKTKIKRDISVEFDGELGTQAGSWKGGVVGCSHEMLPGETPLQTLRRMEKERTFR